MTRLFFEHDIRKVTSLNGAWKIIPDYERNGEKLGWQSSLPESAKTAIVPHVWNLEPGLFHHFDVCWYEKVFKSNGGHILISFGAVSGLCRVWLDGAYLGEHYGGFSEFDFTAKVTAGEHRLCVRVDGSSDKQTIPLPYVDWFHYCGIIRDVELAELPETYICRVKYDYTLSEDLCSAEMNISLTAESFADASLPVHVYIGEKEIVNSQIQVKKGERETYTFDNITLDDIKLWDVGEGNLYTVYAIAGDDDMRDRIGFRHIEARGREILLNGKPVFLKGVNRHEEHPDWGFAVPPQINRRDMDIIKELNCNTIRGSHYQNSRAFLDMLDENGLLFWSEIPMWGYSAERMADPVVIARGLDMHTEMASECFNHPSIVMWGLNNECATNTPEGHSLCSLYASYLRMNGGNRLITFASNVIEWDTCLDLVDVVSVNKYIGWYGEDREEWKKFIPWLRDRLTEAGVPDRPVIMSEFGAAGMYGYTSFDGNKWTEEYQAELISDVIELCRDEPGVVGTYVWQFCDIRSENERDRARFYNNKGIVNEFRRPKLAYYAVKKLYGEIK